MLCPSIPYVQNGLFYTISFFIQQSIQIWGLFIEKCLENILKSATREGIFWSILVSSEKVAGYDQDYLEIKKIHPKSWENSLQFFCFAQGWVQKMKISKKKFFLSCTQLSLNFKSMIF